MKNFIYILLIAPLFFISSCEEEDLGTIHGCLDSQACNYNPEVTLDNNSCEYAIEGFDCDDVIGCTDSLACNYNSEAIPDNNSCEYALQGYDCDGNEIPQIGDQQSGGIVFYIDGTGEHGLVAAMEDLGQFEWGCYQESVDGADGMTIGTGYQNTLDIVAGCSETPIAASEALAYESGGYSDWYLPSIEELELMYNTIGQGADNYGGFEDYYYWSSSEFSSYGAWRVHFYNGYSLNYGKYSTYRVRVIRAF